MANNTNIVLDGTTYAKFPLDDEFYPPNSVCVEFDLDLPNWDQKESSQIVGNYNGSSGYGVFYQSGIGVVDELSIVDSGNNQLFRFNADGGLVSQTDLDFGTDPLSITHNLVDKNGVAFVMEGTTTLQPMQIGRTGHIFVLDLVNGTVREMSSDGSVLVDTHPLTHPAHNAFIVVPHATLDTDLVVSFFSNTCTPMLLDCDRTTLAGSDPDFFYGNYYNMYGINLYRNGIPFFYVGPTANTFGIDAKDNIWVFYNNNRVMKIDSTGRKIFDKKFHDIRACDEDLCDTTARNMGVSFTKELTTNGIETFTWVAMQDSNYILKLDESGDIVKCIFLTNFLDVDKFPDKTYDATSLCPNGDFTGFYSRKKYSIDCSNSLNNYIVARIAITNACGNDVVQEEIYYDVSGLTDGSHNIQFCYDGLTGEGKLFVDQELVGIFTTPGQIYYNTQPTPTLIGADSGTHISKKEEQGIVDPVYFQGVVGNLKLSTQPQPGVSAKSTSPVSLEWATPFPIPYKERVDSLFLLRPPGFKSSRFNLTIENSGLGEFVDDLSEELGLAVEKTNPAQNELHQTEWVEEIRFGDLVP